MIEDNEPVQCPDVDIVVVDRQQAHIALAVDDWNATTLIACVSEDPADWSELQSVWPRYQKGASAEELNDLGFLHLEFQAAMDQLSNQRAWMVIDMRTKRVCVGKANDLMERDGFYVPSDHDDEMDEGQAFRIPVHLPPWWEFDCHVDLSVVDRPRSEPVRVHRPLREVLWGPALSTRLAELMTVLLAKDAALANLLSSLAIESLSTKDDNKANRNSEDELREIRNELHARTIAVHRDWLMTPRSDLDGRMPRQCLHGGIDWIERVVEGQKLHLANIFVPLPDSMALNPNVPMGLSEVCLYFDLCRELIHSGWIHLGARTLAGKTADARELADYLAQVQGSWMKSPHEGGASPAAIIEAERYRVPRMLDPDHAGDIDCDCPICEMMKEGTFGPTFEGIDGHHLELDGEFAFSLRETKEEWGKHQEQWNEMSGFMDDEWSDDEGQAEDDDNEFDSVWKNTYIGQGGIPGDTKGHIEVSFLLADMISSLKELNAQDDIDELNQTFRQYRRAGQYEIAVATKQLQDVLEGVAQRHSALVSRSADLQQRLWELSQKADEFDSEFGSDDNEPF